MPRSGPALLIPRANMPTVARAETCKRADCPRNNGKRLYTLGNVITPMHTRGNMLTSLCAGLHSREHAEPG